MLNKPTKASRNTSDQNKHAKSTTLRTAQHGCLHRNPNLSPLPERGAPLLSVPGESLTHITSYLDVPSLLNLSRVNKSLHEHVNNDSTWYRALLCQFLGISPETDLQGVQTLSLRRTESTWKKEFVYRHITSVYVSNPPYSVLLSDWHLHTVAGNGPARLRLLIPRSPVRLATSGLCQKAVYSLYPRSTASFPDRIL